MPELRVRRESWPIRGGFVISRGGKTQAEVVVAEVSAGGHSGRGECVPYARYGETIEGVIKSIDAMGPRLAAGLNRLELQEAMPAGAARNAIDCALWDLEAKRSGKRVWDLAGVAAPRPLTTAYTLSLGSPEDMRRLAEAEKARPLLKLKLAGKGDLDRIEAVRAAAPGSQLIVDANEAWSREDYEFLAPKLVGLGVSLIEQPFPAGPDAMLANLERPVPVCADESCHGPVNLAALRSCYDAINIKLDKTGGLTGALALRTAAREQGLSVMVGCMVATSLAMAPAVLVAQGADWTDLDGPLLLARDREPCLRFDGSTVHPPQAELWG
ncbi:MAG: N-acetyl-D-Glu racemase DgcA [Pseudomonadota bacterium]|nr:N-acetyl-D-Glu racemase DgcA [Pseudomonadota bacterium]